jgi:hypothetical protein
MQKRESELVDAEQLAEIGVGKKEGLRVKLVANLQETIGVFCVSLLLCVYYSSFPMSYRKRDGVL